MNEEKTERQKMLEGSLYLASDPELVEGRMRARKLVRKFNKTKENETSSRFQILEMLFGEIGNKIEVEPPFFCDYGSNIFAGDGLFMNFDCVLLDCCRKKKQLGDKHSGEQRLSIR
jgi:maltose O-acetyltransferase